jgi:tetratricopeptide (TPR) repeat protein
VSGEDAGSSSGATGRPQESVGNVLSGTVQGPTVQSGVVQGGIHFHSAGYSLPVNVPVPRQIPLVPGVFLNRVAEGNMLDAVLADAGGRCVLVAVGGSGGVGKTALGAWWLQRHRERFADGELYADLGAGRLEEPLSASEVLGRFLRALGVASEGIPVELAERAALYRSITADRSLAVLLDNAVSAAQVRPLVPNSASSTVVVTSRVRLAGLALDGARFLDLAPLDIEDGVKLLSGVLGRARVEGEADSAVALVRLCSGFPLALVVVGARMIAHPRWSLAQVVGQLEDDRRRLAGLSLEDDVSVQAVFDASYEDLPAGAARLYRLLAVCPGEDFPVDLIDSVVGSVGGDTPTAVSQLVEANLIEERTQGRFCYHDLLRVHARQLSERHDSAVVRDEVRRRAIGWYLDCAVEADLAVNRHRWRLGPRYATGRTDSSRFASVEQALGWFERERPNLLRVLQEAHAREWDDLVWQWCEALWSFFLYRKHYQDWLHSHRLGIQSAARCGHRLAESRVRCQLGFAHLDLEHFDTATEICAPALALAEAEGHRESISTALSQLAKAARGRGDLENALGYLRRSLALVEETGNRHGVALRLRRIGTVLADQGRYDEAIDHMRRSVSLLAEVADVRGRARALTILGRTYMRAGRFADADAPLREALTVLRRESGPPTYQADILCELATLAERGDEIRTALRLLGEAVSLYRESEHPRWEEIRARLEALESRHRDDPQRS